MYHAVSHGVGSQRGVRWADGVEVSIPFVGFGESLWAWL